ncbi:glycosyltransferase [Actinocatenispora rupis]|uniref:Glucosyltransferase n=1 Tax=Actinocatenispora rupis TaxID=519421 RepID=A0A8J3J623_9ACTN|nr:glycosyltransferase [Actinocatenispora rupis]GID09243.1 glucosyltransferase [Actinocatenispora rupis]
MTALAIGLAVLGAVAYALAAQLQHGAVRTALDRGARPVARLLRQRRWLAGLALIGTGAGLHAAALGLAPLTVVQPVGVLAVVLVAVLQARSHRSGLGRRTVLAIAATTLSVGGFVAVAAGDARSTLISDAAQGRTAVLAAAAVAVLGAAALLWRGRPRCLLLATAGGVAYGFVSVSTRVVVQRLTTGGLGAVPLATVLGIGVALAVGGTAIQLAYASGPPTVVVACLTMADPFFAVAVGALLLGEGATTPLPVAAGQLGLAGVAAAGVALLARFHPDATTRRGGPGRGRTHDEHDVLTHPAAAGVASTEENTVKVSDRLGDGRLRIVVGADTFPPDVNGAARFSYRLATGLAARGHDVHVLAPSPDGAPGVSMMDGVTVHRVRARRTPFHPTFRFCTPWQAARAADDLLTELAPDLVHIQSHFLVGRALSKAAVAHDIPLVATNHFMPENLFGYVRLPGPLHRAARDAAWRDAARVFGRAKAVTAPTQRAVDLLQANGIEHGEAVSCGIDLERFGARRAPDAHVPTVLFVGRLDAEKRVDELIRAASMLPPSLPFRIELIGTGSRRAEWERLAASVGVTERITFRGFVPDEDLPAAYEGCDVFCIPGVAELQSLVTMEAMAAGRPVVAADAMALPHLVHHGENGWLYTPGDVPGLADRLAALLTDPDLRVRMGEAGRRRIAEHGVTTTLRRYEEIYGEVLGVPVAGAEPVLAAAA